MNYFKENVALIGSIIFILFVIVGAYSYNYFSSQAALRALEAAQQTQENADLAKKLDETTKRLDDLANKPPQTIIKEVPQAIPKSNDADYSAIVAEWQNRVANVVCYWDNPNGSVTPSNLAGGSALLMRLTNIDDRSFVAMTNRHVVINENDRVADRCFVGLFGGGWRLAGVNSSGGSPFRFAPNNRDSAYIKLVDAFLEDKSGNDKLFYVAAASATKFCSDSQVRIGDRLIVLGYPTIGAQNGITVTEGIISSGLEDGYYVTSAKIDHGNSGGAAILVKDDCYIGIPTWVAHIEGGFESLGRILKTDF